MSGVGDDALRLPIKVDTTSNGEFAPVPLPAACVRANAHAGEQAERHARRLGVSRRAFLASACGAASTLLALDEALAGGGRRGGFYDLPRDSALEPELAEAALGGAELIFDVQGHHVAADRPWREHAPAWERALRSFPFAECGLPDELACFSARRFVKEVFVDSDTALAVLSFVPEADRDAAPLRIEEAAATRELVDAMQGSGRLLLHGPVHPNFPGELDRMEELAQGFGVAAWKTYTQYGPGGRGYRLDDERVGVPFVEKARSLGVRVICVHKGFPLPGMQDAGSLCDDVGPVARRFPDVQFIVYHSGFETATREGPYGSGGGRGIDSLVRSLEGAGVAPGSNVHAELGSTWRFLMRDPTQAAHALGKLLRGVGEDNVLWGTDSIWYGSPQDQIQAFRVFQIAEPLRERHGYPALTPSLREKIFGGNALRVYGVAPAQAREALRRARTRPDAETRAPRFETYGPRTRREFLALRRLGGGAP